MSEPCKRVMLVDKSDHHYDYGTWETPDDGWTEEDWEELIYAVQYVDRVYWDLVDKALTEDWPPGLDALGKIVENGYAEIIEWLAPELTRIYVDVMRV